MLKITEKYLSIPPYISTSWDQIGTLYISPKGDLIINLKNGREISLPHLSKEEMETIFSMHSKAIEKLSSSLEKFPNPLQRNPSPLPPLGFSISSSSPIDAMGSVLQHNPEQKDAPDLPEEILNKISGISKILGMPNQDALPEPEEGCNCMYCQIARSIRRANCSEESDKTSKENIEEIVSDQDLKFREWDIQQIADKLFSVTSCTDDSESYRVYLGSPIGCTCGQKNCEHIRAVLNS